MKPNSQATVDSDQVCRFRVHSLAYSIPNSNDFLIDVIKMIETPYKLISNKIVKASEIVVGESISGLLMGSETGRGLPSFLVSITSGGEVIRISSTLGILFPGSVASIWHLYSLNDDVCLEELMRSTTSESPQEQYLPTETYSFTKLDGCRLKKHPINQAYRLKMRPPQPTISDLSGIPAKLTNVDPQEFLAERYFTTLYNTTIPLQYFTKTALSRMHVLSHSNEKLAIESISKLLILTMSEFNERFSFTSENVTIQDDHLLDPDEFRYRKEYLHNCADLENRHLKEHMSALKYREAKLQVVLNLEVLRLIENENGQASISEKKPKPMKKQSLVGRKKRLVPTLVGTMVPLQTQFTTDLRQSSGFHPKSRLSASMVQMNINALVDQLCVADAISGHSHADDESTFKFLMNCVIPYFQKVHPNILKELVRKSRGPSVSRSSKKMHDPKNSLIERQAKSEKVTAALSDPIDLSDFKIKRKPSSLGTCHDLSRKTFEMVKSTSFSQTSSSISQPGSLSQSQSENQMAFSQNEKISNSGTAIFSHRRRKKDAKADSQKLELKRSYTEIEATPVKKSKNFPITIMNSGTPTGNRRITTPFGSDTELAKETELFTPTKSQFKVDPTVNELKDTLSNTALPQLTSPNCCSKDILIQGAKMTRAASSSSNFDVPMAFVSPVKPGDPIPPQSSPYYTHRVQTNIAQTVKVPRPTNRKLSFN
ncbi:hypothetical protein OGAPHI_002887 [Ogataea philodendri]|uniref:DNA replication regulator Sld3 C-terminal domain-containing protein n=1 Tax=Ogataea philodendri TaxID=1378263 RepID=A0A9P8P7L2_9ASCO|nr:uncharacterized protein OGAPHI_002887 [Ogataea philodendri]KAH3667238.1 hypothetical protein OGAPHI_002887 [Ogataea philodendri]